MTAPSAAPDVRPVDDPDGDPDITTAGGPDYSSGIMVALIVPEEIAEELAVPDGLPPGDLHVTLAYLGTVDDVEDPADFLQSLLAVVSSIADDHDAVEGVIGGVGRFSGSDEIEGDPFYASLDAPGLDELRVDLLRALRDAELNPSESHGFTPHITLAYVPRDSAAPLPRLEEPIEVAFGNITLVYGNARIDIGLGEDEVDDGPSAAAGDRRAGPLTAEEIADPRTWGELFTLRTYGSGAGTKAASWTESLHPRAAGGKFAPKDKPVGAGGELPPDWIDRVLRGDTSFVKGRGGGKGKGKGKGRGKGRGKGAGKTAAKRAAREQIRAARQARMEAARRAKDAAEIEELENRDKFDRETEAENRSENQRRMKANSRIDSTADKAEKETLRKAEKQRRADWAAEQQQRHGQERTRRRTYEMAKKRATSNDRGAEYQRRTAEDRIVATAGGKG